MMKRLLTGGRKQRGAAAVEFALVVPVFVVLLGAVWFFGRVFWHYSVAQKAAHDAAMLLAHSSKVEIAWSKPDLSDVEVANLAKSVAAEELAELNPGVGRPRVEVYCDDSACVGDGVPGQVRVYIRMQMYDVFFGGVTDTLGGNDGLWLRADVRMPYVGN
jgi:Flp pilus assembly protein TadG